MQALDMCYARDMLKREGIHIISNLPIGKYIDFSVRKKYRIAEQYIDKKQLP